VNKKYSIVTLASHSALQILKGAKDENFNTFLVSTPDRVSFYQRFPFIDKIITVSNWQDFLKVEPQLQKDNAIVIPHGTFVAHLGIKNNKKITLPYFGNKAVLDWEADREKQSFWLKQANINTPKEYSDINQIEYPVIVKTHGADGGSGYFYAGNKKDLQEKLKNIPKNKKYTIQQYVIGVNLYIHYFYSPLTKQVEILGMDRRYETNVDSLGRIPSQNQQELNIEPSFTVVGNTPVVLRESMMPEAYDMGERLVAASQKLISPKGLFGPFCLETIITPDLKFHIIEISCRIVAGTNIHINGSPYSDLVYGEPMSTGRRIAREINLAQKSNQMNLILD
jgi:5-formaminoimidazole-4-carboxamide-1-(beta)-D-ribofuranosyl 5'-monophosphate synthetase